MTIPRKFVLSTYAYSKQTKGIRLLGGLIIRFKHEDIGEDKGKG